MNKKRFISLALVLVLSLGILSGCGSKESADDGKTTIRFATWDTGDKLKIQQDLAKKFEAENPDIKVQVEAYGDGFDQKIAASFGAKNPADVVYMWDFPTYHDSLMPLGELLDSDEDLNLEDIYPGLFNYCTVNDEVYGLPAGFTTHVIYYNKDLFDEAGVDYPEDGWTWDEFLEIAEKLTDKDSKQYGFSFNTNPDPYDFEQFIWSNDSAFISPDGKELEGYMNGEKTAEVFETFLQMKKDQTAYVYGTEASQGAGDLFKSGKLAMIESGIWPLESFKEAGVNVGVVELPAFANTDSKSVINVTAVSIAKDSKHPEEAWEFAKFFISETAMDIRKTDLPVRQSYVEKNNIKEDEHMKPFYSMLERAEENTPAYLLNKNWKEIQENLSYAIEAIYESEEVQKHLDEAVEKSNKFLE